MKAEYVINEAAGRVGDGEKNVYTCQTAEKGLCWLKLTFESRGMGRFPMINCVVKMARPSADFRHRSPAANPTTKISSKGLPRAGLPGLSNSEPGLSRAVEADRIPA
jgi:hypothetical protein